MKLSPIFTKLQAAHEKYNKQTFALDTFFRDDHYAKSKKNRREKK